MGKIILVPSIIEFDKIVAPYGGRYTGTNRTYPAMVINPISTLGDEFVTKTELSSLLAMTVSVSIPEPGTDIFREDPMQNYVDYFNCGRLTHSKRPKETGSWLGWTVNRDQIAHTFWDFRELEDLAATLKGDLLVQPGKDKWSFHGTHPDDSSVIPRLFSRTKKYRFSGNRMPTDMKEEVHGWLVKHISEFDYEPNQSQPVIYIRNETEAAHFKLKWVGENIHGPIGS